MDYVFLQCSFSRDLWLAFGTWFGKSLDLFGLKKKKRQLSKLKTKAKISSPTQNEHGQEQQINLLRHYLYKTKKQTTIIMRTTLKTF